MMRVKNSQAEWNRRFLANEFDYLENPAVSLEIIKDLKDNNIQNPSLLDIGCFTGILPRTMHEANYHFSAYKGIDWSDLAIEKAENLTSEIRANTHFEVGNFTELPPCPCEVLVMSGVCWYYQSDKIAVEMAKKHQAKFLVLQDLIRTKDFYKYAKQQFREISKRRFTIDAPTKRKTRMIAIYQVQ